MIRRFAVLSSLVALSACASATKGPVQEVTFYTTGAESAICYIEQDGFRQRIWVPQRVHVSRSSDDMIVTCAAPGNREKVVVVGAKVNNSPMLNAWNGVVPGMAYDYGTGAMFSYPDTVEIDFSDMEYGTYDLPAYELVLRDHPEVAGTAMEEFRPGTPALIRDQYEEAPVLRLKDVEPSASSDFFPSSEISSESEEKAAPAGEEKVTEEGAAEDATDGDAAATQTPSQPAAQPQENISYPASPVSAPAADSLTRTMNPQAFEKK